MKKLILSAAILLGSLSTFAQTAAPAKTAVAAETTVQSATTEEYKEVPVAEVPEAVKASLTKAYPTAVLNKAYINEKKEYKLEITVDEKAGNQGN